MNLTTNRSFDYLPLDPLEKQSNEEKALMREMCERIKALGENYNVSIVNSSGLIFVTSKTLLAPKDRSECETTTYPSYSGLTLTKSRPQQPKENSMYYLTKDFDSWTN